LKYVDADVVFVCFLQTFVIVGV